MIMPILIGLELLYVSFLTTPNAQIGGAMVIIGTMFLWGYFSLMSYWERKDEDRMNTKLKEAGLEEYISKR